MGEIFGGSQPSPPAYTPPPAMTDPAVEEVRKKRLIATSNMKGRQSTLLTGGQGDETLAPTAAASLLGR